LAVAKKPEVLHAAAPDLIKRILAETAGLGALSLALLDTEGVLVARALPSGVACPNGRDSCPAQAGSPCPPDWQRQTVTVSYRQQPIGTLCACYPQDRAQQLSSLLWLTTARLQDHLSAAYELHNLSREIVCNYEHLSWLCRASTRFGSTLSPERICERLAEEVMEELRPQNVLVALLDPDTGQPRVCACCGEPTDAYAVPVGDMKEGVLAHVLASSQPTIVCNVIHSAPPPHHGAMVGSVLCVPLAANDKVLGAVCAREKLSGEEFFAVDMKLVSTISAQSAVAISNSLLFQDIKELFLGTVRSLASAVDAKDPYTLGHSQRVTRSVLAIAEELEFPADSLEDVQLAGLLHDVGKIGLPDHILLKPGRLSDEEWAEVKKHPARGEEILRPIKQMARVATWIRHEHERWDGSGYPDSLRGAEIPLASRIIAVADAYDALTSERSYRRAVPAEAALSQLQAAAGTDYDPMVVEAFLRAHSRGRILQGTARHRDD